MPLFRAVSPTSRTIGAPQTAREDVRLPKHIPYVVDNLWEHLRPDSMPCRRHAVYASPTPELALQNAARPRDGSLVRVYEVVIEGAYKAAQLRVTDAREHGDISAVQTLLQDMSHKLLAAPQQERQAASLLFMPGSSRADWEISLESSCWAREFLDRAAKLSTFWTDATNQLSVATGEVFFELDKGAKYRLVEPQPVLAQD